MSDNQLAAKCGENNVGEMTSQKTLYLHLGAPKTGTTSIQKFFTKNRWRFLNDHNLYYPFTGCKTKSGHVYPHHIELFTHSIVDKLESGLNLSFFKSYNGELPYALWQSLTEEVSRFPSANVMLSCELIGHSNEYILEGDWLKKIRQFFSGYSIRVIYYIRRIDDLLLSLFNQNCKQVGTIGNDYKELRFSDIESYATQFSKFMRRIVEEFSEEELIFRNYGDGFSVDTLQDILKVLCIDPGAIGHISRENTRVDNPSALFLFQKLHEAYRGERPYSQFRMQSRVMEAGKDEKFNSLPHGIEERVRIINDDFHRLIPGYASLFAERGFSLAYPGCGRYPPRG